MQIQLIAITFTLVFLAIEAIWLVTIRNRYIILISCTTILIGIQILLVIMNWDHFSMGRHYLMQYLINLLLKDSLLIFAIWIFFYTSFFKLIKEIPLPNSTGGSIKALWITFNQLLSEVRPINKVALVLIPCVIAFLITPLGVLFMVIPLFWPLLIGEIIEFPKYLHFSPIHRFLPSILIGYDDTAVISGWFLYLALVISTIISKKSFWLVLYFLFIFLLINNIAGCGRSLANM